MDKKGFLALLKKTLMNNQERYCAIGKRKTSVAKVFLKEGLGNITVNEKKIEDFFSGIELEHYAIKRPLFAANLEKSYDIIISVKGGGTSSQISAVSLAVAKCICQIDDSYRSILNKNLFLRRDSRIKERRKYGLKKARKASQYSKR